MSPLAEFLEAARRGIERRRALVWLARGAAAAAVGSLAVQLAARRWLAGDPLASWMAAAIGLGMMVFLLGWLRGRPTVVDVARLADHSLGGRERLATALELAGVQTSTPLVHRQQADTEAWIRTADPNQVSRWRLPRVAGGVAVTALGLASVLAVLPNPALAKSVVDNGDREEIDRAADDVAAEAEQVPQGAGDPDRRQALVNELRRTEQALREAPTTRAAVAELSRAQERLKSLAGPGATNRRDAAAGAGTTLSQSPTSATAGGALARLAEPTSDDLRDLADALDGLADDQQTAVGQELSEAAEIASDPVEASALRQAAAQLAAGQAEAARQTLAGGADDIDQGRADAAAQALDGLAQDLPSLSPEAADELTRALEEAAGAAQRDSALARALADAAREFRGGESGAAAEALSSASEQAGQLPADSELDNAAAEASGELESAKAGLLGDAEDSGSPAGDAPSAPLPAGIGKAEGEGGQPQSELPFAGQGQGEAQATGQGGGQAASQGSGQGQGGEGLSQGQGGGSGSHRGGGASGGGSSGGLGVGPPGLPSEEVYVPGLTGPGRVQSLPGEGGGQGRDAELVPYERVYSSYREEALSQGDRELVPLRLQDLLRRYFQETPP